MTQTLASVENTPFLKFAALALLVTLLAMAWATFEPVRILALALNGVMSPPVTLFCSARQCYQSFGGGMERGAAQFDWGEILPPESWVPYTVEHEYIHMLKAQRLGLLGCNSRLRS